MSDIANAHGEHTPLERIVGVAVKLPAHKYDAYLALPPPCRHHDVLAVLHAMDVPDPGPYAQGFSTDRGRWVSRQEACLIAERAQQITMPKRCHPQDELFSEDLF